MMVSANQLQSEQVPVVGVLLAGGQSRRMFASGAVDIGEGGAGTGGAGSGDKGLLDIAGKPMLGHVIDRMSAQVTALVINANGDPERFAAFALPLVADTIGGHVGPLAGVLAGMRWAAANVPSARYIATVSTDAPFVPVDLVERLSAALAAATGGEQIALARSGGHLHPVIGLWPVALADDLDQALHDGVRKVLAWTDRHGTLGVDFAPILKAGEEIDPFFNANTPSELDEARRLLGVSNATSRI